MDKYIKHYNDHYLREGESGAGQLVWKPQFKIWQQAGYELGMSVLDYGCGVGIMTESPVNDDEYFGVDISEEAIRLAKKRYPGYNFMQFEIGKLESFPFNMAVAQSIFTHTPKSYVDKCLRDISLNFTDFAIIDVLHGYDDIRDEHVRRYTVTEWQDVLWKNHLKGEQIGVIDFIGYEHFYYKITHGGNRISRRTDRQRAQAVR